MFLKYLIVLIIIAITLVIAFVAFKKLNPAISKKELKENIKEKVEFIKEDKQSYLVKLTKDNKISNKPFRIMSVSDLHLCTDESIFGLTILERMIKRVNPDLVILVGDNVCNRFDDIREKQLISIFERLDVFYSFVLGNHDSEKAIYEKLNKMDNVDIEKYEQLSRDERLVKFNYLSNSKKCVAFNQENIFGIGNHYINIKDEEGIINTIYLFDSGDYVYGLKRKTIRTEKRVYNYIHDDQLDWYSKCVNEFKSDSIVFMHIPLIEYKKAYRRNFLSKKKEFGNNYETPCSSYIKSNAFKAFKENNTKLVVVGHDHKNDSCINYKGVKLMFSQGLQYDGAYNRRKKAKLFKVLYKLGIKCYIEGASVYDVSKNNIDITPVYAEKENMFEGLEKYYKRSFLEGTYKK